MNRVISPTPRESATNKAIGLNGLRLLGTQLAKATKIEQNEKIRTKLENKRR